ncbi:MAG: hypothetical protein KJ578_01595 [Bacteroidetes bacterium]|nr:hypothetical protein [Bacteroidota bacterium]
MARHQLSKSTYIRSLQCQKSLYLHKKRPFLRDKMLASQLAKFRRGTAVGKIARDLFPGGIDMTPKSPSQYQIKRSETLQAMADPQVSVIYEAVFQYDEVLIMLDILVREADQWRAIEVKSSRGLSETYREDAYLQYFVLKGNQVALADFELMYINENYILNGELNLRELFISESVMQEAEAHLTQTDSKISLAKETLELNKSPEIKIGPQCRNPYPCDFLGHCWKNIPKNSLLYIAAIPADKRFELFHNGIHQVNQLSENQITPLIREQDKALQKQSFTINNEKFLQLSADFNKQKLAFIKVLYNQPAIPVLQHTKAYSPYFLAISVVITDGLQQELHNWDCSENHDEWQSGFDFLASLSTKADVFISFKDSFLNPLIQSYSSGLKSVKIIDLWEFLKDSDFYVPLINTELQLDTICSFLLDKFTPLKDEAWLLKDLLEDPSKSREMVIPRLQAYASSIMALANFISDKIKTAD